MPVEAHFPAPLDGCVPILPGVAFVLSLFTVKASQSFSAGGLFPLQKRCEWTLGLRSSVDRSAAWLVETQRRRGYLLAARGSSQSSLPPLLHY